VLSDKASSLVLVALGVLGGLWLVGEAMFVASGNPKDSGTLAVTLVLATPLLACLLALWNRTFAGCLLLLAAVLFPIAVSYKQTIAAHTIPETLRTYAPFMCPVIAFGLFFVLTARRGWPKLLRYHPRK
jgi:hypothetical protein